MEAILFIGMQASGKSTFYKKHFFNSHVRISMDLLKTRNRERQFLQVCLKTTAKLVIDNTNPRKEDRQQYIPLLKERRYQVIGYYFQTSLPEALARNSAREGKDKVKDVALYDVRKKLEPPAFSEGFDRLFSVRIQGDGFEITEWRKEEGHVPEPPDRLG
ncbi:AAA family ATPase [Rufibacter hautae]|uniref:AAA family ATPase n=1 Tax=Rufibacter hautae TaxID=2595005 RepID=A0A5B6TN73_9BACT|nr:AAA family ATPase [Rufibacter hautae]KAA3437803.1 AAA family ATPase [Rufibacter hautae]